jgi:hypothetical protein
LNLLPNKAQALPTNPSYLSIPALQLTATKATTAATSVT